MSSATAAVSRKLNPEATREHILATARAVFGQHGFDGTSMSQLAAETGVTQSLIHHHFGSKRALWNRVKEWYAEEYAVQVEARLTGGNDPVGVWTRLVFDFHRDNPELARLVAWLALDDDRELPASTLQALARMDEFFRRAQARGRVRRDLDPRHVRIMISQMIAGWFHTRALQCVAAGLDPAAPATDRAFLRDLVAFVRAGLAPGSGRPRPGARRARSRRR
jgi:TetR/AcrR family transcriptional regulator